MARAREQIPRLDGPVFPSSQDRRDLSFGGGGQSAPSLVRRRGNCAEKRGCQWPGKSSSGFPLTELDGETSLSMVMRIAEWVSITALLLVVSWRPFASYQIPLDLGRHDTTRSNAVM